MDRLRTWIIKNDIKAAAALMVLGAALRLLLIGAFPPGLNQDEASAGYEAWSLLNFGIDRNGCPWPVLFVSWGSGQNVLYSYLSIPFIALLGLNEVSLRLPMAITGSLALLVFWLMQDGCEEEPLPCGRCFFSRLIPGMFWPHAGRLRAICSPSCCCWARIYLRLRRKGHPCCLLRRRPSHCLSTPTARLLFFCPFI